MLPEDEIDLFLNRVDDAIALAAEGKLAQGHTVLLAGLDYAEEAEAEGKEWANELIERYQQALENYASSYGLPLEE